MGNLNEYTLVLNKGWTPVAVTRVKDALVKLFNNAAKIVDENTYETFTWDEWVNKYSFFIDDISKDNDFNFIFSQRLKIRVPEVIVLNNYSKIPERKMRLTRKNLLLRDRYTCQYSGKKLNADDATIDHIVPQSRGGKSVWENVVICSPDVNSKKANKTPNEAGMKLLKNPHQPVWHPLFAVSNKKKLDSWKKFL